MSSSTTVREQWPYNVYATVALFIPIEDVCRSRRVCKAFKRYNDWLALWEQLIVRDFPKYDRKQSLAELARRSPQRAKTVFIHLLAHHHGKTAKKNKPSQFFNEGRAAYAFVSFVYRFPTFLCDIVNRTEQYFETQKKALLHFTDPPKLSPNSPFANKKKLQHRNDDDDDDQQQEKEKDEEEEQDGEDHFRPFTFQDDEDEEKRKQDKYRNHPRSLNNLVLTPEDFTRIGQILPAVSWRYTIAHELHAFQDALYSLATIPAKEKSQLTRHMMIQQKILSQKVRDSLVTHSQEKDKKLLKHLGNFLCDPQTGQDANLLKIAYTPRGHIKNRKKHKRSIALAEKQNQTPLMLLADLLYVLPCFYSSSVVENNFDSQDFRLQVALLQRCYYNSWTIIPADGKLDWSKWTIDNHVSPSGIPLFALIPIVILYANPVTSFFFYRLSATYKYVDAGTTFEPFVMSWWTGSQYTPYRAFPWLSLESLCSAIGAIFTPLLFTVAPDLELDSPHNRFDTVLLASTNQQVIIAQRSFLASIYYLAASCVELVGFIIFSFCAFGFGVVALIISLISYVCYSIYWWSTSLVGMFFSAVIRLVILPLIPKGIILSILGNNTTIANNNETADESNSSAFFEISTKVSYNFTSDPDFGYCRNFPTYENWYSLPITLVGGMNAAAPPSSLDNSNSTTTSCIKCASRIFSNNNTSASHYDFDSSVNYLRVPPLVPDFIANSSYFPSMLLEPPTLGCTFVVIVLSVGACEVLMNYARRKNKALPNVHPHLYNIERDFHWFTIVPLFAAQWIYILIYRPIFVDFWGTLHAFTHLGDGSFTAMAREAWFLIPYIVCIAGFIQIVSQFERINAVVGGFFVNNNKSDKNNNKKNEEKENDDEEKRNLIFKRNVKVGDELDAPFGVQGSSDFNYYRWSNKEPPSLSNLIKMATVASKNFYGKDVAVEKREDLNKEIEKAQERGTSSLERDAYLKRQQEIELRRKNRVKNEEKARKVWWFAMFMNHVLQILFVLCLWCCNISYLWVLFSPSLIAVATTSLQVGESFDIRKYLKDKPSFEKVLDDIFGF